MIDQQQAGIEMIAFIAEGLGELRNQVVFVGGAVVGLLVTDPAARPARPTEDVDVIVSVITYSEYARLEEELRRIGFRERRMPGDPICRWSLGDAIVDVMPTDGSVLGFRNRWYTAAMENATERLLRPGLRIRLITAPCFVATKIDAFRDRGNGDYQVSRDIEDIVSLIEGRAELAAEVAASPQEIKEDIARTFGMFLKDDHFLDALPGHLYPDSASQGRLPIIEEIMRGISLLA